MRKLSPRCTLLYVIIRVGMLYFYLKSFLAFPSSHLMRSPHQLHPWLGNVGLKQLCTAQVGADFQASLPYSIPLTRVSAGCCFHDL